MLKLQTVFSYRFNDQFDDNLVKKDTHVLVRSKFTALPTKYIKVSRGHFHKSSTCLSSDVFLNKLNFYLQNKLFGSPNFSRIHLSSMKKSNLKQRAVFLNESLNDVSNSLHAQRYI